jgi:hypothetical protein
MGSVVRFPAEFIDANRAYFTGLWRCDASKGDRRIRDTQWMPSFARQDDEEAPATRLEARTELGRGRCVTTCVERLSRPATPSNALPQGARREP